MEITINEQSYFFNRCKAYLDGKLQSRCFEAVVSPLSFAEPTHGKLFIEVDNEGGLIFRKDGLREGEIEYQGLVCHWVTGLVRIELDSSFICRACGAADSIKYNAGIEKVWCSNCGVDAVRDV